MSRLEQLEKLRSADPHDADVLYMLAQEHAKLGDHAKAVESYDACLDVDPAYHYAYFHKARSLESLGQIDEMKATLEAGVSRSTEAGDEKASGELREYLASIRD